MMKEENIYTLPFDSNTLYSISQFLEKYLFTIDYKESIKNFNDDNEKFLNYIKNCNMKVLLENYDYDELFADLLLQYVKLDRRLNIAALSDTWVEILYTDNDKNIKNQGLLDFIKSFRSKYKDTIKEINDFFYSMNIQLSKLITETEEEPKDMISLKEVNCNVVSISNGVQFYTYIANVEGTNNSYEEFYKPVMDGNTLVSYFLTKSGPYKAMYIYNQLILHPELKEDIQKQLDEINKTKEGVE